MKLSNSGRCALGIYVAIAVLAGCGGSQSSALSAAPQIAAPQSAAASSMLRAAPLHRRSEKIDGKTTQSGPCYGGHGVGPFTVSGKGDATGPYRGTFTGSATFVVECAYSSGHTQVMGQFVISSGANTISGSFSGDGTFGCDRRQNNKCEAQGNDFAYIATLVRGGKMRKSFSGNGPGLFGSVWKQTLSGM
jgi:hypothetical protein